MTAKEKAKELYDKYYLLAELIEWTDKETSMKAEKFNHELGSDVLKYWNKLAKQCAIIAVDEIIKETDTYYDTLIASERKLYWEQVKTEIENL